MVQTASTNPTRVLTRTNFFSRREMVELPNLLMPGEKVLAVISGFYAAGTAILCVTSRRILLVDKKMIRLSIEDLRYDSIKEVNYSHQAFFASLQFFYVGRSLQFQFKTWHKPELRVISQLVQQKMFEVRDGTQQRENQASTSLESNTKGDSLSDVAPIATRDEEQSEEGMAQKFPSLTNPAMEKHLVSRTAQWQHAGRFVDTLALSVKTGRQILRFETENN